MKKELNCPLCHQKNNVRTLVFGMLGNRSFRYQQVYSELGKGCKMCGMHLEDRSKEFCSEMCRGEYRRINRNKTNPEILDLKTL